MFKNAILFMLAFVTLNCFGEDTLKTYETRFTNFLVEPRDSVPKKSKEEKQLEKEAKKQEIIEKKKAKLEKKLEKPQRSHVFKVFPISLPVGKLGLDYEYRFSRKSTIGLNVGLPSEAEIPQQVIDEVAFDEYDIKASALKGKSYRVHYRFYPGKRGAPRGFYIEPYFRTQEYTATLDGVYNLKEVGSYENDGELQLKGTGGGLQFGSQFLVGNRFVIDLTFLGIDLSSNTIDLKFVDQSVSSDRSYLDDMKKELDTSIKELPFGLNNKITTSGGSQDGYVAVNGDKVLTPGLRFNIGFGFAF